MPANHRLKYVRVVRGWSQQHVAKAIGTTHVTVSRWERGITSPYPYLHQQLCELFGMDAIALGLVAENAETTANIVSATKPEGIYDHTIPFITSTLVGRDHLIDHVRQLLSDDSASISIALNGLPGVGKTALAITLASDPDLRAQFPDGILWAALGPQPNVSEILSRWAALFGIAASGMGTLKDNEIWARTLQGVIGTRRFLIVIDDLWDIDAAIALKVGGSHCAYLVTTRFPQVAASFAMKGAIKVSELSEEDGVMLLHHLAPEVATYDADMVRLLVRSVGSLPLALTLVGRHLFIKTYAGQSRRFRLAIEQLQQVEYRLRLSEPSAPTNTSTNLPAVSLQAVIAMSDEYLDEQARQTLRALSVFPAKPNTFSEEAAIAVSGRSVEGLDVLIDAGLLEISGADRYTLHQAITDYARVQQNGKNASQRFAEYYRTYIEEHQKNIERLQLESQNLFSALEMVYTLGASTTFVPMVFALTDFLLYRGLYDQAKTYLTRAYEAIHTNGDFHALATCLHHLGIIAQKQGEYQQATVYYQEGLTQAREANWQEQMCALLSDLGWVSAKRGRYEQAYEYAQEGLTLAHQINDEMHLCRLLTVCGVVKDEKGDFTQAEKYYQEGLILARKLHDQEQECILLIDLGANADYRGILHEVQYFTQKALECARSLGHLEWQCVTLSNMSESYEQMGEYEQAQVYNHEAVQLARQLGHREWLSHALIGQAELAIRTNDHAQAETILQEALALAIQIEKPISICEVYCLLGHIALLRQQFDTAFNFFSEMLQKAPSGLQRLKAESLYRLALVSSAKGEQQKTKELGDKAYTLMVEIGGRHTEEVRQWIENGYPPSLPAALM